MTKTCPSDETTSKEGSNSQNKQNCISYERPEAKFSDVPDKNVNDEHLNQAADTSMNSNDTNTTNQEAELLGIDRYFY